MKPSNELDKPSIVSIGAGKAGHLRLFMLADDLERPIGACIFNTRTCYLSNLWVDARHRRRGLGKKLLGAALAVAKSEGLPKVIAATHPDNTPAQELFDAANWKRMIQYSRTP